jgi:hypothetical protein
MNRKQFLVTLGAIAVLSVVVATSNSDFGAQPGQAQTRVSGQSWQDEALVSAASSGETNPSQNSTADVSKVLGWLQRDDGGRYMITGFECTPERSADWPGYKSLPDGSLKRCSYSVTSCKELKGTKKATCEKNRKVLGPKLASVVLLEPGLERFAQWIVSACTEVGGDRSICLKKLYELGHGDSNWQFPIAGIVYEDMESKGYVQYGYAFRDGLTVNADSKCGWRNGTAGERAPTPAENIACSRPDATPRGVSFKARPMSTTRTELIAWRPELATQIPKHVEAYPIVGPSAEPWRQFVRDTLVASFTSDKNPLVTAKAFALRHQAAF